MAPKFIPKRNYIVTVWDHNDELVTDCYCNTIKSAHDFIGRMLQKHISEHADKGIIPKLSFDIEDYKKKFI